MHGGAAGEDPGGLGEMTEASKSEERSDVIGSAGGHLHLHAVAVPKAPHLAPSCPACLPPRACLLAPASWLLPASCCSPPPLSAGTEQEQQPEHRVFLPSPLLYSLGGEIG